MNKKKQFKEVDSRVSFPELENELLRHWYKDGIVDKYLKRNDKSDKYFSFQDGPITANNPMGVHHAWGRSYKDLWQRYHNMKGYKQRFQNGFDCQGLWVEVEVEKDLGFKTKKDIEDYGVAEFVQKCKDRVMKYSGIQTEQTKRLGNFMDWENSYYTMSDQNNYMIWHFIKTCHEHGWLYKGKESVPWCPRCETAISQHEMLTEDYKEVTHKSIFFELPIEGRDREFLLVWTTTPWTLPANIAVAVDKNMDYSLVTGETGDKPACAGKFWVAKEAVERIFGKDAKSEKTVKGSDLVGLKYRAPFDDLPAVKEVAKDSPDKFHVVVETDDRIMPISASEGTGLVHTAVGAGTEDFRLGKKLGLPMLAVIEDDASYMEGFGFLTGKNAKKNPELVLNYLVEEDKKDDVDWVFKIEKYKHRYPGCWRCKEELVWKVADEWYIAMDAPSEMDKKDKRTLRERMIEVAKKIEWMPEFGLKRELDWLNNMHDWLISKKNRYWGLCLPIWECTECGHFEVVGGKDELKEKSVEGWDKFDGHTPHKPFVDEVLLECPKCKDKMHRIEPVGNPWLDAGIVPFSTISENNTEDALYLNNKDEWRKWFPIDFITESFPGQFKNWFYSMIAMSTVLEDENPFKRVLGFATLLDEKGRAMHKSWGNSIEFNEGADKMGADVMRWIYARQNPADNLLFGYKYADEVRRQFHLKLWNSYKFFVTYANQSDWTPSKGSYGENNILDKWIVSRFKEMFDAVEKNLNEYNAAKTTLAIEEFVLDLSNWYVRRSRDRASNMNDSSSDRNDFLSTMHFVLVNLMKVMAPINPFITEEIYTNLTGEESVHLADWPELSGLKVDSELHASMMTLRNSVEAAHAKRKEEQLALKRPLVSIAVTSPDKKPSDELLALAMDEVNVKEIKWLKGEKLSVNLDTTMTDEIEEEMKVRELTRQIQNERKNMGVSMTDEVVVVSEWLPDDKDLLEFVKKKTLAKSLTEGKFSVKKA